MKSRALATIFAGATGAIMVNAAPTETSWAVGAVNATNHDLSAGGRIVNSANIYARNDYDWPVNGTTSMAINVTQSECNLKNETITINFDEEQGHVTFMVDYIYQGDVCKIVFVSAESHGGPRGFGLPDDIVLAMSKTYYSQSVNQYLTYIETCTKDEYINKQSCGNIDLTSFVAGGINIPDTIFGIVVATNHDLTAGGKISNSVDFYEIDHYAWPTDGSLYMMIATETTTQCNKQNQTIDIEFEEGKGDVSFLVDYVYDGTGNGFGCTTVFVDAIEKRGPKGKPIAHDVVMVMSQVDFNTSPPATYIQTCKKADFKQELACGNIAANNLGGGIHVPSHIPTTGHVMASNKDATIFGWIDFNDALFYNQTEYQWPSQASYGVLSTTMSIRAQKDLCKTFKDQEIIVRFAMNEGSVTFTVDYDWVHGGCVPIFKKVTIQDGPSGSAINPDVVMVMTHPMKTAGGVPIVHISDCSTTEFTQNGGCPNAPTDSVAGGLNLPPL
eukprot:Clim_evm15s43 gene=Clim_evmTU15s43